MSDDARLAKRAREIALELTAWPSVTGTRGEAEFADRLLSAMRYEFGGHVEKPAGT